MSRLDGVSPHRVSGTEFRRVCATEPSRAEPSRFGCESIIRRWIEAVATVDPTYRGRLQARFGRDGKPDSIRTGRTGLQTASWNGTIPTKNAMARSQTLLTVALLAVTTCRADDAWFKDDFTDKLGDGWSWVREHREAWRVTARGLEVRIEPGNMWGPANDAKNVLVHPLPVAANDAIEISAGIEHHPTGQYEQVDLVWYYDDGHMVKLGEELVDGQLSIVMGREENDHTRTIAIIPLSSNAVQLRLIGQGSRIRGEFRTTGAKDWRVAGECDLPVHGTARACLQFYQGPVNTEHWAKVSEFRIRRLQK